MPRAYTSGPTGLQLILVTFLWILAFFVSIGLAVTSLITECWIRWKEEATNSEHCFGLFLSSTRGGAKPCKLETVVRETGEELFRDFDLESMIVLMFLGIGFDTLAVTAGLLYCFAKGKAKNNLWKRSIPTLATGLIAAGLMFLACLIFVVDLEQVSDSQVEAHVDERCTTNVQDVKLAPTTGFSVFLALASGTIILLKSTVFGVLVSCF